VAAERQLQRNLPYPAPYTSFFLQTRGRGGGRWFETHPVPLPQSQSSVAAEFEATVA